MSLYETLFPYQKNIIDKFKDKERYGLFLDMGLGKTLVSLAFTEIHECTKVIVITINGKAEEGIDVKGSWMWWGDRSNVKYNFYNKKIFHPTKKKPNAYTKETNDFLLLNYESLYVRGTKSIALKKELMQFIESCKGHTVGLIIDESHKIKTTNSVQCKSVNKLFTLLKLYAKKTYLYLGTGTIFTSGLEDTFSQLKILGWEGTKTQFIDSFCIRGKIRGLMEWQQPIVGYKNVPQLYELIHQYGITIKSEDVIELPEKVIIEHNYPETLEFKLLTYDKIKMEFLNAGLRKRDLPEILNNEIYSKMTFEAKSDFWAQMNITISDDRLMLEGDYDIASINDSYTDVMDFLAKVYDSIDDLGAFEWLRDRYYLFEEKKPKDGSPRYHVGRVYKANRSVNNPFYRNLAFPKFIWDAETSASFWMRARQISIGIQGNEESYQMYNTKRFDMLREFLSDYEDNYLLFYNYVPELTEIYKICEELGYKIDVWSGPIKNTTNYQIYESQTEGERMLNTKNIILANFESGSAGMNWQLYNKCIIFSTPLFKNYDQSLKRIHRIGQKETCFYHFFAQANWLEEEMTESLKNKGDYNSKMFLADLARVQKLMGEKD